MAPRSNSMRLNGDSSIAPAIHPQIRSNSRKAFINPSDRQAKLPRATDSPAPSSAGSGSHQEKPIQPSDVRKPTAPTGRKLSRGALRPMQEKQKEQDGSRQRPPSNSRLSAVAAAPTDDDLREVAPHIAGGAAGLIRVDKDATSKAIQAAWKGGKRNVTQMCEKISMLLDNPILAADSQRASVILQRHVRGWLLRKRRAAGELFPVEKQALCDSKVLLRHYGASSFSLTPQERRKLVGEHFAALRIQRFFHGIALKSLKLREDSPQTAAARTLQRCVRRSLSKAAVDKQKVRASRAAIYQSFLFSGLEEASQQHARRMKASAASRVQAAWKGRQCRRRMEEERVRRRAAVVRVQSLARGWVSRVYFQRLLAQRLLKRTLTWWNKIMWTMASPLACRQPTPLDEGPAALSEEESRPPSPDPDVSGRYTPAHVRQEEEAVALETGMRLVERGGEEGIRRSLYLGDGDDLVVVEMGAAQGAQTVEGRSEETETPWRVLPGSRGGEREPAQKRAEVWPEWYGAEVCRDRGALALAMAEDRGAMAIQAVVRGHRVRRRLWGGRVGGLRRARQPARAQEASAEKGADWELVTPVRGGGLPPTPGTRGANRTPPSGRFSPALSPSRPGSRGVAQLAEWKKGIADQVHVIHTQLEKDSEKRRLRSRSPSPHPPRRLSPGALSRDPSSHPEPSAPHGGLPGGGVLVAQSPPPPLPGSRGRSPPPPPREKSSRSRRAGSPMAGGASRGT